MEIRIETKTLGVTTLGHNYAKLPTIYQGLQILSRKDELYTVSDGFRCQEFQLFGTENR
jgi:hypothetical protein